MSLLKKKQNPPKNPNKKSQAKHQKKKKNLKKTKQDKRKISLLSVEPPRFFSIFLHPSKLFHDLLYLLYLHTPFAKSLNDFHCVAWFAGYPYALLIWFCITGASPRQINIPLCSLPYVWSLLWRLCSPFLCLVWLVDACSYAHLACCSSAHFECAWTNVFI